MKTLVIVESPTKAKTIGKFLGRNYTVKSSMGHVRDLPKSELGVDIENNFTPKYITIRGKGEVIKVLKDEAKKADRILLASDPDREGEAIAWHLQQYFKIANENCRIEFNEITDTAVKKAVQNPRPINMDRVEAQQARRILDRLVGYKISPLLWKKVKKGLSAGRVQSVAVRLICDREEEIKNFIPEEYWSLLADLESGKGVLSAKLVKIASKKAVINNQAQMTEILDYLKGKEYKVSAIQSKPKKRNASPPFTTSSMQQEASRNLNMTAKKTMQIAQQLYEGVQVDKGVIGLITYMRTDSTRISQEAQDAAREYIKQKYGADYIPPKPNVFASKGRVQNAHEAVRPTSIERTPASLKPFLNLQQYKLYKLIYERFMASQMSPALFDSKSVEVTAGNCLFRASGDIMRFAGFMQVYVEGKDESGPKEEQGTLAPVKENQVLELKELCPKQHFTQAQPRYNEASLVKALEELGIGRPSTYAPIIDTILARGYVVKEEKLFFPTELGTIIISILKEYFKDIIDVEFTAGMEEQLDAVEEGDLKWEKVLEDFYKPFAKTLAHAEEDMAKITIAPEESDEFCEKCGKVMVYRMGRYGTFLACSGFPQCRNTKPIVKATDVKCLSCGGNIVQRKSRTGRIFYGCDNYPKCQYVSWDLPITEKCIHCGTQLSSKTLKGGNQQIICPNKNCPAKKTEAKKPAAKETQAANKKEKAELKKAPPKAKAKKAPAKPKKAASKKASSAKATE